MGNLWNWYLADSGSEVVRTESFHRHLQHSHCRLHHDSSGRNYNVPWTVRMCRCLHRNVFIAYFRKSLAIINLADHNILQYGIMLLILFGLQIAIITLGIFHGFGERVRWLTRRDYWHTKYCFEKLYNFAFRELIAELQQYPYDDRARGFIDFFQVKVSSHSYQYILWLLLKR